MARRSTGPGGILSLSLTRGMARESMQVGCPCMQRGARGWARAAIDTADRLLERRETDVTRRLAPREQRVELVIALLFVVAALLLLIVSDDPWPDAWTVIGLVLTYAV